MRSKLNIAIKEYYNEQEMRKVLYSILFLNEEIELLKEIIKTQGRELRKLRRKIKPSL